MDGKFFRLDNAPHYKEIKTFPSHFHEGTEDNVRENSFGETHQERFVGFMEFIGKFVQITGLNSN